jgi:predicted metal-dependent HD superfamily phosphohydrolase
MRRTRRTEFTARRFGAVLAELGLAPNDDAFADLAREYGAPGRHYHTGRHIADCLAKLDRHRTLAAHAAEIEVALFFHDAIYDPRRSDNEARSADWAAQFLEREGLDAPAVARVRALVLATCHEAAPNEGDQALLVDIDLSILGAEPPAFRSYDREIAREFAWLAAEQYRAGRSAVLKSFLARPRIFSTPPFLAEFEARARRNLELAILALDRTS